MDSSMPGSRVHHQLPEFTQTHIHWVGDAIQPSHPLSSPSPPALNLSQHQGLLSQFFASGGQGSWYPRSLNKRSSDCCKPNFQNCEIVDFYNFCQYSCCFYREVSFQRPLVCHSYWCPSDFPRCWHGLFFSYSHPDNFPHKDILFKAWYKFFQGFSK